VSALATAAGWGETCRQIAAAGLGEDWDVMVQSGATQYLYPITTAFTAIAQPPEDEALARFIRTLARRGVGRLALTVTVEDASGRVCARFEGEYVAQRRSSQGD
jgi:thioesterase domain-containing protein